MIKINTLLRVVYTLGVSLILSQSAFAQSVLNFARTTVDGVTNAGFSVVNPTTSFVDVQFTLYGFDGNPVSTGLVNPVSYRIPPKGQLSMLASEVFGATAADGWVQITSPTSGLIGSVFAGDFFSTLEGLAPLTAYATQVVPGIREDGTNTNEVQVLNPNATGGTVTITFFNARGDEAGSVVRSLTAHAAVRLVTSSIVPNASGIFSARISSTVPVAAVGAVRTSNSLMYAAAQPVDQQASMRIASSFVEGNGSHSILVVANPGSAVVNITVGAFNENGGPLHPSLAGRPFRSFAIPPNGSTSLDVAMITGMPIAPSANGWLTIESPNVALAALMVIEHGQGVTAVPVETRQQSSFVYSQISESDALFPTISLVNLSAGTGKANFTLVRQDGTASSTQSLEIPGGSKFSALVDEIFPERESRTGDYLYVTSSTPLYATEVIEMPGGHALAAAIATPVADSYRPSRNPVLPAIIQVNPGTDVRPGTKIQVSVSNWSGQGTFLLGDVTLPATRLAAGFSASLWTYPPSNLAS